MKTVIVLAAAATSAFAADCTLANFAGLVSVATYPAGPFATCAADIGESLANMLNPNWIPKDGPTVAKFAQSANCKKFLSTVLTFMATINPPCTLRQAGQALATDVTAKLSFDQAVATWAAYYNPTSAPTSGPTSAPTSGPTGTATSAPTSSPTSGPTGTPTPGTPITGPTSAPTNAPGPNPAPAGSCIQVSSVMPPTASLAQFARALVCFQPCPKQGDAVVQDCHSYLPSASNGKCVAPVDAVCQKIPSGAFGCVWPSSQSPPAPASPGSATTAPTPAPSVPSLRG
uniref:Secreted protein n=1 Tax=Thraustotheca clavata TaxID=74557 RepID=A0A0A7CMM1_9STRA|nr:secreted protein [Thraustotheca clavata]